MVIFTVGPKGYPGTVKVLMDRTRGLRKRKTRNLNSVVARGEARGGGAAAGGGGRLRFGVLRDDGWFAAAPALARALEETVQAARARVRRRRPSPS